MKANMLLSCLCLAPLALAGPIAREPVLFERNAIRGSPVSVHHHQQIPTVLLQTQDKVQRIIHSSSSSHRQTAPTPSEEQSSSPNLVIDGPKTTHELMQGAEIASKSPSSKASSSKARVGVSVGMLVAPAPAQASSAPKMYDPATTTRYLSLAAEYAEFVAAQRVEVLMVGLIFACVVAVLVVEIWDLVAEWSVSVPFRFSYYD